MREMLSESPDSALTEPAPRGSRLHGKFAVIKLWPGLKTAEDECIARLKLAAQSLGLECLEVDSFARLMERPYTQLTQDDVDFVLSLHFETPKRYDIFSFVALWNPLQFFHEWGYRRFTRNLLTHDDFLSCASPWADDQVRRLLASDPMREPPELRLYHSLSEPILSPTIGEGKLFYAGINWERITNKPQRHGELLRLLDEAGDLRIYGPKRFQEVEVWSGYKSYAGPIPFDGVSMIHLIHKAGISLVLSSEAHRQSELMSSRLFESLAAGAVIICDENAWGRRYFGKTLLYVDTSGDAEDVHAEIQSHLQWIRAEPEKARELAGAAQDIFRKEFSLDLCLRNIYRELPARKARLAGLRAPARPEEKISVLFLMPEFEPAVLDQHVKSCLAQQGAAIRPILVVDERDFGIFGARIRAKLGELSLPVKVETLKFRECHADGRFKSRMRLGQVLQQAIQDLAQDDYFCIVGPHEQLFSDHLSSLLHVLQDNPAAGSAWADILYKHKSGGTDYADLAGEPAIQRVSDETPISMARFLFRKSALPRDLSATLSYLDSLAMMLLFGLTNSVSTKRCTVLADIQDRFNTQVLTSARVAEEREILVDYAPAFFGKAPSSMTDTLLDSLTLEQKQRLATELAHSFPVPQPLMKIGFGLYRFWLRRHKTRKAKAKA